MGADRAKKLITLNIYMLHVYTPCLNCFKSLALWLFIITAEHMCSYAYTMDARILYIVVIISLLTLFNIIYGVSIATIEFKH